LSNTQRTQLLSICVLKQVKQGDSLFRIGDACNFAFLICDGEFIFDEVHGTDFVTRRENEQLSDAKIYTESPIVVARELSPSKKSSDAGVAGLAKRRSDSIASDNTSKKSSLLGSKKSSASGSRPPRRYRFSIFGSAAEYFNLTQSRVTIEEERNGQLPDSLKKGAFVCDMLGMQNNLPNTLSLSCISRTGTVFEINKQNISAFLDENPVALLSLLKSILML